MRPDELHLELHPTMEERLASLVSGFGLDPDLAAGYASDTTVLYGYPGVDTAFSDRLDELKATIVAPLLGLCVEAYGQGFDDPVVRRQVRRLQHRLGAHGSPSDPRLSAELAKRTKTEASAAFSLAVGHVGLMRSDLFHSVVQSTSLHYFFELGRQYGFDAMQRPLVTGCTDRFDQAALGTVPKGEARQLIDVLARLHMLVGDDPPSKGRDRLAEVMAEERALRGRIAELQHTSRAAGVPMELPTVAPVQRTIERLSATSRPTGRSSRHGQGSRDETWFAG